MSCGCSTASVGGDTIILGRGPITVSGSGTAFDPYILGVVSDSSALRLSVRDSATVDLQLTGTGTALDPFVLRADTSAASSLRSLSDVSATPVVEQGRVPQWIGSTAAGRFEMRFPGVRYTTSSTRGNGLFQGEMARDTDTQKRWEWDGGQWLSLDPVIPSFALDPSVVQNAGTITSSTNWNDLKDKSGIYRVQAAITSGNNGPQGAYGYGTLLVIISGQSVTQTYWSHNYARMWQRTKFNDTDWTGWTATATLDDITNIRTEYQNADTSVRNDLNGRMNGMQNDINGRAPYGYVDTLRTDATNADNAIRSRLDGLEVGGGFGFSAAGNFSVNRANTWRRGGIAQLDISLTRQGTAIGSGDISNIQVGTITGGFGCNGFALLGNGPGGGVASGYINGTAVVLSATTQTIQIGQEVTLCGTWIMS